MRFPLRFRLDRWTTACSTSSARWCCKKPLTVAVMGCVVNGPGEASAADIGVAGGKGEGLIFRHGEVLYKVAQEKLLDALLEEIEKL